MEIEQLPYNKCPLCLLDFKKPSILEKFEIVKYMSVSNNLDTWTKLEQIGTWSFGNDTGQEMPAADTSTSDSDNNYDPFSLTEKLKLVQNFMEFVQESNLKIAMAVVQHTVWGSSFPKTDNFDEINL